ncbi:MAG TPA: proton-conducting transporter membrane subunit [Leptospiraceae bacterium]|nr:proton-conducting transporter membrane subunit [Leptospiraceae bacterium]HMW07170.1 proton-conducting transporter membrane subunit [Leptospiraceae bacterium]HMX33432.1 proton-conducting transporter membrane subunit [Leptospiraceae bacterium]HMY32786.1 proton-conducting transporter membrane subunit [Leptospiraceae bacterium]HMZ65031.1 proton-conducting transporter membrane subunit [Leptospiraceae bacterium]
MSFLHILTGFSLFLPILWGIQIGKDFMGLDFPLLFGLCIQAVIGNFILIYARGYETKERGKIIFGYFLFFAGLSGAYLAGKTIWLPVFWEISTLGSLFIYLGQGFSVKAIRSVLALFLASSTSMVFLASWVFLPEGKLGYSFLMLGLLIKAAFSLFHMWLPEAHAGPPAHGSAAYSGLMINLPLLLFVRYMMDWWNEIPLTHYLIPMAGVGVFLGGITSFFSRDAKKSLAYSTVENSNFLWLFLFVSALWIGSEIEEYNSLGKSFLVLFYLMLLHHSFSKVFQFLSIGYICKKAKSTLIDTCRGVGRISGLSTLELSPGTMSFAVIPGTTGFIAEATLLFLISKTIDLSNVDDSVFFLLAIVLSLSGLVLGSAAHVRLYLPLVLSIPDRKMVAEIESHSHKVPSGVSIALKLLGAGIFIIPILLILPTFIMNKYISCNANSTYECVNILSGKYALLANWIPSYLLVWLFKLSLISAGMTVFYMSLVAFRWAHKIYKRRIWDCGSNYAGPELSIPASVISDPLYHSIGRYFINKDGELYFDNSVINGLVHSLNLGKYWIDKVESGEIAYYILFSALSFLLSLGFIIFLKVHI